MYHVRTTPMQDMMTSTILENFSQFEKHRVEVDNEKLIITIRNPNDDKMVQFSVTPVTFAESAIKNKNTINEKVDRQHPTYKIGRFMIAPDNVNIVAVVPESNELGFLYNPIQTNALLRPCVTMKYADAEAGIYQHLLPQQQLVYRNLSNGHTKFPRAYSVASSKQFDLRNNPDANGQMTFFFGLLAKPAPVVYRGNPEPNPSRSFRGGGQFGHGAAVGHGTTVSQHFTVNTEFEFVANTKFEVRIMVRVDSNRVANPSQTFGVKMSDFAEFPLSDEDEDEDEDTGMEVDADDAMRVIQIPETVGTIYVCKRSNLKTEQKEELKWLCKNFRHHEKVPDHKVDEMKNTIMEIFGDHYDGARDIKCRCETGSNIIVVINPTTNCQYFYPITEEIFEVYDTLCDVECLKTKNIHLPMVDWQKTLTWTILMDEIKKVEVEEKFYSRLHFYPYKYPHSVSSDWWARCDMCDKRMHVWDRMLSIRDKDLDFCPACDKKLFTLVKIASCALPQLQSMCKRDY